MSVKTYHIGKGKHYPKGLNFGLTFKKNIKFRVKFNPSCLYDLGNKDNYDINKLFGFSTTWFHHKQSARIGWRCITPNEIEILTYSYNSSVREIEETDILGTVKPNEWFYCEIIDKEDNYLYIFKKNFNERNIIHAMDEKKKDWFFFHYLLFPYFGGNNPAPHDMKIQIERL